MKKLITTQEFEEVFRSQWKKDRYSPKYEEKIKNLIICCWDNNYRLWTEFMQGELKEENKKAGFYKGDTEAFLYRVLQKLKRKDMKFFCEVQKSIRGEKPLPLELKEKYKKFSNKCYYQFDGVYGNDNPLCPDMLIEHENNDRKNIKKAMWRLLMFRSPLKVLVCYHWNDKMILKNVLCTMADTAREIDENSKEIEETEYLIVIGSRNCTRDDVIWEFKKLDRNYKWINNS